MKTKRRTFLGGVSTAAVLSASGVAFAQKKYSDGASDTEIKIGHTNPYSGPASSYGIIGKAIEAYWKSVNDRGGINGRKITFITLDDGYSPPKTVEVVRQLVEQDKVLCTFNTLGTPTNTAIHKYMNQKKVPMLFVATGASKWGNPKEFPWTMGYQPDYHTEGVIYAKHLLANVKDAKIGVLMQNDDYGKDYFGGFKEGLGKDAGRIVKHVTYETTDPTVEFAGHSAQGFRRQRLLQHLYPQIRGPGHAQGGGYRLEARTIPQQRIRPGLGDDEASRLRERARRSHRGISQRSHRPPVGQ